MTTPLDLREHLVRLKQQRSQRTIVAIAGAPASGKTTLARELAESIPNSACLSMDGYHLDNPLLQERNLLDKKGSPETFDLDGFSALIARLKEPQDIYCPIFDRQTERTVNSAHLISKTVDLVIVEGNYLLLDEPGWADLRTYWDYSVFLEIDIEIITQRLLERWLSFGYSSKEAWNKSHLNDLPNARRILENRLNADLVLASATQK